MSSKMMYDEQKDKFTEDELYERDFQLFSKYIEFKNDQERRDTKRNFKSYNDDKLIKKMYNTILDLIDTCNENDRIISCKDIKIRGLQHEIQRLKK
jgi:hypothetical protein